LMTCCCSCSITSITLLSCALLFAYSSICCCAW
jgi:hypothetical protein